MASTHRVGRVRQMLLRELSDIVGRMLDPRVRLVTVVDAELSKDLKSATMYVSVIGDEREREEALAALEAALGHIRYEVAQRVQLRQVPEIRVEYDSSLVRAARVTALIDGLHKDADA
jgi:ribosome-binding factor A